ncbi:AmpG family muropeptide MFS transporter [Kiloniella majae]|uniref:AmpG family muropeptide MFS transporter n=1 Tax=Kiloniella majae TaxID=1938558 RepID=UPI001C3FBE14|nr:MFS transporter [Kiloniella majae]
MRNRTFEADKVYNWIESCKVYLRPRVIVMLFLGFSAGLPYVLIFSTLSAWLSDAGVSRTEIGYFAWVGIAFSVKFLWAPLADHFKIPLFGVLGKRRAWMITGQIGVIIGLIGISMSDPSASLSNIALFSLLVAFSSATQDIGVDAYRIEALDKEFQAAMAANYILGYRTGLLVAGGVALGLADIFSWPLVYQGMAILMCVGVVTVLIIDEPENKDSDNDLEEKAKAIKSLAFVKRMYFNPFSEFYIRLGKIAGTILVFICLYKLSDIILGNMANPFYLDLGFSKTQIGTVVKGFGFFMLLFGAYAGGFLVMKIGLMRVLLLGAVLVCGTNLFFASLAQIGYSVPFLIVTIGADSFAGGLSATALIAYLSSLVNQNYTATQYALFSSIMTLPGKITSGFSGKIVDATDYTTFFIYASIMGIPAIIMVLYLMRFQTNDEKVSKPTEKPV